MKRLKISIIFKPPAKDQLLIEKTIISILSQTFTEFELLILVNNRDFNWFNTHISIIEKRIRFVITEDRASKSLNIALNNSKGKYVCFIDAFDEFAPKRLNFQFDFLETHTAKAIAVGFEELDVDGNTVGIVSNLTYHEIKTLLLRSYIGISTLMFKRSLLIKHELRFDEHYDFAYSYDYLVKAVKCFSVSVSGNVLSAIRTGKKNSKKATARRIFEENLIKINQLKNFNVNRNCKDFDLHLKLLKGENLSSLELKRGEIWLNNLLIKNRKVKFYKQTKLYHLFEKILKDCIQAQSSEGIRKELNFSLDVILVSFAINKYLKDLTQQAIDSVGSLANVYVVECNKGAKYNNATVIYPNMPFNYNRYLNIGARKGQGEYIFFGNNDLIFTSGWEAELVANMKEYKVVWASPICPNHGRFFKLNVRSGCLEGYESGHHFCGWAFVWTRDFYYSVKQLDESYIFWHSDDAVISQLKRNNKRHLLITSSVVRHFESGCNTLPFIDNLTIKTYTVLEDCRFYKWRELRNYD